MLEQPLNLEGASLAPFDRGVAIFFKECKCTSLTGCYLGKVGPVFKGMLLEKWDERSDDMSTYGDAQTSRAFDQRSQELRFNRSSN